MEERQLKDETLEEVKTQKSKVKSKLRQGNLDYQRATRATKIKDKVWSGGH